MARRFTENAHKLGLTIHGDFIVGLPGETRETLRNTIDFAKRLDVRNHSGLDRPRVSGHRVLRLRQEERPGQLDSMTDENGHQLPNVVYPGLDRGELVEWVERFYGEYYFRPKAAWRVVRKAIFNNDVPRLYKEAREYLALRSKRKRFVRDQKTAKAEAVLNAREPVA